MSQSIIRQHITSSNDGLIYMLVNKGFIHTADVEKVFRIVDRGVYYSNDRKHKAYMDSNLDFFTIHLLSTPSVYATVLECLKLRSGYKFLYIGSGIGYLSTAAGLLLGLNGVNHGIEIHKSLIDYALEKLEEFKLNSAAIDYFDFCEPIFIQGNAWKLMPSGYYDRVYCETNVPSEEYEFLKLFINVGGILVMPLNGVLVQIIRTKENSWVTYPTSQVFNTNLVVPEKNSLNIIHFPPVKPLSLQELCRSKIRSVLRENLIKEFPNLAMHTLCSNNVSQIKNINLGHPLDHSLNHIPNIVEVYNPNHGDLFEGIERLENDVNQSEQNENTEGASVEPTIRESPEAGGSMQNNTSTGTEADTENPQRMNMNNSPRKSESVASTSSHNNSDSWKTVSTDTSSSSSLHDDSNSSVSASNDIDENLKPRVCVHCYECHAERHLKKFSFVNERKENELSKHLKDKIDSLQIPTPLKVFLNYN